MSGVKIRHQIDLDTDDFILIHDALIRTLQNENRESRRAKTEATILRHDRNAHRAVDLMKEFGAANARGGLPKERRRRFGQP